MLTQTQFRQLIDAISTMSSLTYAAGLASGESIWRDDENRQEAKRAADVAANKSREQYRVVLDVLHSLRDDIPQDKSVTRLETVTHDHLENLPDEIVTSPNVESVTKQVRSSDVTRRCEVCGSSFTAKRAQAKTCSPKCRKALSRMT